MINQLKDQDKNVSLKAKIEQIYLQNAYSGSKTVQNLIISDDSGKIKLTLWDKPEIPQGDSGKVISIKKGYVTSNDWKGKTTLSLNAGQYSFAEVDVDEFLEEVLPIEPHVKEFLENIEPGLQKENILKIMDEIIRHLQEQRQEISEM